MKVGKITVIIMTATFDAHIRRLRSASPEAPLELALHASSPPEVISEHLLESIHNGNTIVLDLKIKWHFCLTNSQVTDDGSGYRIRHKNHENYPRGN